MLNIFITHHTRINHIKFPFYHSQIVEPSCGDHLTHSLDLVTTLRSELAASTYKRDRLIAEVNWKDFIRNCSSSHERFFSISFRIRKVVYLLETQNARH